MLTFNFKKYVFSFCKLKPFRNFFPQQKLFSVKYELSDVEDEPNVITNRYV
jgi:hypothetical protein